MGKSTHKTVRPNRVQMRTEIRPSRCHCRSRPPVRRRRIRAKATQYLDKRMDTLLESGQKAYEVKVVMETLRLIADMEKSDAGAAEEAAVQIVEDLTQ